jgi:hypothetical protein
MIHEKIREGLKMSSFYKKVWLPFFLLIFAGVWEKSNSSSKATSPRNSYQTPPRSAVPQQNFGLLQNFAPQQVPKAAQPWERGIYPQNFASPLPSLPPLEGNTTPVPFSAGQAGFPPGFDPNSPPPMPAPSWDSENPYHPRSPALFAPSPPFDPTLGYPATPSFAAAPPTSWEGKAENHNVRSSAPHYDPKAGVVHAGWKNQEKTPTVPPPPFYRPAPSAKVNPQQARPHYSSPPPVSYPDPAEALPYWEEAQPLSYQGFPPAYPAYAPNNQTYAPPPPMNALDFEKNQNELWKAYKKNQQEFGQYCSQLQDKSIIYNARFPYVFPGHASPSGQPLSLLSISVLDGSDDKFRIMAKEAPREVLEDAFLISTVMGTRKFYLLPSLFVTPEVASANIPTIVDYWFANSSEEVSKNLQFILQSLPLRDPYFLPAFIASALDATKDDPMGKGVVDIFEKILQELVRRMKEREKTATQQQGKR